MIHIYVYNVTHQPHGKLHFPFRIEPYLAIERQKKIYFSIKRNFRETKAVGVGTKRRIKKYIS